MRCLSALYYGFRMRTALTLSLITLLALSGCVAEPPVVLPSEEPSSSPVFASDEEALAAAEEALGLYFAALDEIGADGGSDPERLAEYATAAVVDHESVGFSKLSESGYRTEGARAFDSLEIQSADSTGNTDESVVVVYVCEDFTDTNYLDASGTSISAPDRQLRWPLVVSFDYERDLGRLLVAGVEDWTGNDFCVSA